MVRAVSTATTGPRTSSGKRHRERRVQAGAGPATTEAPTRSAGSGRRKEEGFFSAIGWALLVQSMPCESCDVLNVTAAGSFLGRTPRWPAVGQARDFQLDMFFVHAEPDTADDANTESKNAPNDTIDQAVRRDDGWPGSAGLAVHFFA